MTFDEHAEVIARLKVMEALTAMAVADLYVREVQTGRAADEVLKDLRRDLGRWFEQIAESSRGSAALEKHVDTTASKSFATIEREVLRRLGS